MIATQTKPIGTVHELPGGQRFCLLTAEETADLLKVNVATIWRWIKAGTFIEPIRFNRCTRFDLAAVIAWIEGDEQRLLALSDVLEEAAQAIPAS